MMVPQRTNWLKVVPEIHQEFFEFWQGIASRHRLPTRESLSDEDMGRWPGHLHLVELIGDEDAKYVVYGAAIGKLHGRDWTGKRFSELDYADPKRLLGYYHDVRDARRPLAHVVNASVESDFRRWSRLFIPFGDAAGEVRYVLVHSVLIE